MKTTDVVKTFKNLFESNELDKAKEYLIDYQDAFEENVYSYNRGVIEFNLANFPESKLYLEKAIKSGLDSKAVKDLISQVDQNLGIKRAQESITITDHLIEKTELISIDITLIMSAALLLGGLISLKKIYGVSLKIMTLLLTTIPFAWSLYYMNYYSTFIATEDREMREGPSKIFEDTFNMPEGIKYIISKRYKNWGYVTYPSKYSGWLKIRSKEKI